MHAIRTLSIDDYDVVVELLKRTPGVSFRDADSRESTDRYLQRNPGLSFVCEAGGQLVGCIMSGHDGRRGYLQHLAVLPSHRRLGIANALVDHCLSAMGSLGIQKSHIDILKNNPSATLFWERLGWQLRTDIDRYSIIRSGGDNV